MAVQRRRLPLITLYVTERCNSRCVTCDYWRHGRVDMSAASVLELLPSLRQLETRVVALSGGEPLLNPEWASIAKLLKSQGHEVWLLTSGLALAKHARRSAELFDAITVSMDGVNRATYAAIRGLDAFDKVCEGVVNIYANWNNVRTNILAYGGDTNILIKLGVTNAFPAAPPLRGSPIH